MNTYIHFQTILQKIQIHRINLLKKIRIPPGFHLLVWQISKPFVCDHMCVLVLTTVYICPMSVCARVGVWAYSCQYTFFCRTIQPTIDFKGDNFLMSLDGRIKVIPLTESFPFPIYKTDIFCHFQMSQKTQLQMIQKRERKISLLIML